MRLTNDLIDYQLCCLQITPDGKGLAALEQMTLSDLWVWSQETQPRQVTSGGASAFVVSWTASNDIVFQDANGDLVSIQPDGTNGKR